MQVDCRNRYSLAPQDALNADYVRDLTTISSYFKGDEQAAVRNYASAHRKLGTAAGH